MYAGRTSILGKHAALINGFIDGRIPASV